MDYEEQILSYRRSPKKAEQEVGRYVAGLMRELGRFAAYSEKEIKYSPSVRRAKIFSSKLSEPRSLINLSIAYYDDNQKIQDQILGSIREDISKIREGDEIFYPYKNAEGDNIAQTKLKFAFSLRNNFSLLGNELLFKILPSSFLKDYYNLNPPEIISPLINVRTVPSMSEGTRLNELEFFKMIINHEMTHIYGYKSLGAKDLLTQNISPNKDLENWIKIIEGAGWATTLLRDPEYFGKNDLHGSYLGQEFSEIISISKRLLEVSEGSNPNEKISNIRKIQVPLARKAKSGAKIESLMKRL